MKQNKGGIANEAKALDYMRKLEKTLRDRAKHVAMDILKDEAERFRDNLVTAIRNQTLGMKPLNKDYKRWKVSKGLDPRILIATGLLIKSYVVEELDSGLGYEITVARIREGGRKGAWLSTIDRAHEYGTGNLPARPHWRPTIAKFQIRKGEVALRISRELAKQVRVGVAR